MTRGSLKFLLPLLLCLVQVMRAGAVESGPRESVGFAGGPIFSIALIPMRSSAVLIGAGTGIYKSINGRTIWTPANDGLASTYVYDIVPDSITATALYAATREGVSKSTDDGEKWTAAGLADYQVYTLAVNPVTATYLAAGTADGVFISTDGGSNWTSDATGPPNTYALAISKLSPLTIYAGSLTDGFYKSLDFGATWTAATNSPEKVRSLLSHPVTSGLVFAGTDAGLYKSTDSGATWALQPNDFSNVAVYDLAVNNTTPTILYAATDNGMYKTTNTGTSWSAINSGIEQYGGNGPYARAVAVNALTPTNLYAGVYSGVGNDIDVYTSTNSGTTWTQSNRTLANTQVLSLAFDTADETVVYAGTSTMGVLKSTDSGSSWRESNEGFTTYLVRAVAVNPDDGTVYAGTPTGLFLSDDSGDTWEAASPNPEIYSIAVDPFDASSLYTGTNHGIFVTADTGETWAGRNDNLTNPYVAALAFHPYTQGELYAGTQGDGVFQSLTGGTAWKAVNKGLRGADILSLAFAKTTPATLFAGTRLNGLYKSTDNGTTWTQAGSALAAYSVTCIAVNPDNPAIIYAGTEGHGFYRSTDSGSNWTSVDETVKNMTVHTVCFDAGDSQRVLAGFDGSVKAYVLNNPPYMPSNPLPADGATNQPLAPTLSWQGGDPDSGDTVTYRVFFGTSPDFGDNATATTTTASYTPGTLVLNKTYYWKVIAVDNKGEQAEGDIWSFTTIVSNPPAKPSNPTPANGAKDQSYFLTMKWDGSDPDDNDTLGYDVYFGVTKQPPLVRINQTEKEFTPVEPLLPMTTYYWKIVARDSNGITTKGDLWSFTTRSPLSECLAERVVGDDKAAIALLRRFRDEVLATTQPGRELIKQYYALSPSLVAILDRHPDRIPGLRAEFVRCKPALERLTTAQSVDCGLLVREASRLLRKHFPESPQPLSVNR